MVILVGISILWIPLIKAAQQGQLFLYIQALTGYVAPPICSLFLLAVFVPRVNEQVRVLSTQRRVQLKGFAYYNSIAGRLLGATDWSLGRTNKNGFGFCVPVPWVR